MQTTFIYSLTCPISGEIKYIGKADDIKRRLRQHTYQSKYSNSEKNIWITELLSEGLNPIIDVLDEVSYSDWGYWEDYWISQSKIWGFELLNKMNGGHGHGKHHPETIEKIRESQSGKNNAMYGKKTKGHTGRVFSEEHKKNISQSKKGKVAHSKLTKDDAINIKSLLSEGVSPYKIAKQYKVNHQTIYNIKNGKTWSSLLKD